MLILHVYLLLNLFYSSRALKFCRSGPYSFARCVLHSVLVYIEQIWLMCLLPVRTRPCRGYVSCAIHVYSERDAPLSHCVMMVHSNGRHAECCLLCFFSGCSVSLKLVEHRRPDFVALHMQEVGGKIATDAADLIKKFLQ